MKLYTNDNGEWFGTQALAKQRSYHWWPVEVPTDKPNLLEWLNNTYAARFKAEPELKNQERFDSCLTQPHAWQNIRECAEKASIRDMGVALAVLMNRLEEYK